jgi:PAS domain-containing protein
MPHPAQAPPEMVRTLRESEERFRTLVQFSFDVYWEADAQHRFIRQEFAKALADAPVSEIGKTVGNCPTWNQIRRPGASTGRRRMKVLVEEKDRLRWNRRRCWPRSCSTGSAIIWSWFTG